MNVYKLTRKDSVNWDEYDSFVVIAKNVEEAFKIVSENVGDYYNEDNLNIKTIPLDESSYLIGSFNAG